MKIDWKECCDKKIVKKVKPDYEMINSLIKSSKNKFVSEEMLEMKDVTAVSKLSLAYDSMRELLEALALKKGYKVYNHECYTAFLKEILDESSRGDDFDDMKKERNAVNYYGKDISVKDSEKLIKSIKSLRDFVQSLLKKE